ncbi:MAG: HAMP domain-containing sensor histidine kinase [Ramlibacter sp.]
MSESSDEQKATSARMTLAFLNHQVDAVRAELAALRADVAKIQNDLTGIPAAQLVEANEKLVLAALKAQAVADSARRRLAEMTRAAADVRPIAVSSSSAEMARADYQLRVDDLREANEQLLLAALNSQELEADAGLAHGRQIKFLAMAAHELRNPLLPLRLASSMLTRANMDAIALAKLQKTINSQVAHMSRLIGDLLDGSRISTGKFRLVRSNIDLSAILEFAVETCRPAMEERRQRFERLGAPGPFHMIGDAVRLVQVFSNLLENAAKYTPEGGAITLEAVQEEAIVRVTVSDTGIGISPQALPHVFELFVQDDHATEHNQGGLGIGLAVVGELVAAHGGNVVAHSGGMDKGSQFIVTLPLDAAGSNLPG